MMLFAMDQLIIDTLGKLLTVLGISFTAITVKPDGDILRVDVVSTEASRLIGWHGETLN